jgi:hypothetical protein
MAEIPNLAGVATKDLVESIGSGRFSASYINWSRTMNLLHQHAPGWMVDYEKTEEGYDKPRQLLHRAPVGGFLMICFKHLDGTFTPSVPQAVMDNRNNAIPFDKITARDITDTQRRGMCMAAAMIFGLGYELWAKMPLESGYAAPEGIQTQQTPPKTTGKTSPSSGKDTVEAAKESEETFRELGENLGLWPQTVSELAKLVKDWNVGIQTLKAKSEEDIKKLNAQYGAPAAS